MAIVYIYVFAFAKCLYAVHFDVADIDIFAIPKCRTTKLRHLTIVYFEIVIVPKRIAKIEIAIRALDVPTLLECAFTVPGSVYLDAFYFYVSCAVKGTFLVKSLVFHRAVFISSVFFHSILSV